MNRIRFLSGAALAFSFFAMVTAAPAGAKVWQFPAPAPMQRPNGALENPPAEHVLPGGSSDPYEPVNRVTWKLDYDYLDHYALRPFVHGYVAVVPGPVRTGISNFTKNLGEVTSFIDNICIGELGSAGINLGRFVTNSTIGLAGLIDVASYAGVPKKEMDFDTVLGKWGVSAGPYVVIPGMGMTTYRGACGTVVDNLVPAAVFNWWQYLAYGGLKLLDARVALIPYEKNLDGTMDTYIAARDFYLQYKEGQVQKNGTIISRPDLKKASEESMKKADEAAEEYLDEIDQ